MSLKEQNQDLCNEFFKLINFMGNEDDLAEIFAEKLVRQHRTLQQNTVRFMSKVIEKYSKSHTGFDLRNEAAVQWAENVTRHHPGAFPFI